MQETCSVTQGKKNYCHSKLTKLDQLDLRILLEHIHVQKFSISACLEGRVARQNVIREISSSLHWNFSNIIAKYFATNFRLVANISYILAIC